MMTRGTPWFLVTAYGSEINRRSSRRTLVARAVCCARVALGNTCLEWTGLLKKSVWGRGTGKGTGRPIGGHRGRSDSSLSEERFFNRPGRRGKARAFGRGDVV